MRKSFIQTLVQLADQDQRIILLTGDLGFWVIEPFVQRFPDRFYNVGVAEQNMVGMATGLAEAGFIPFVYSIVTFATLRPYEVMVRGPISHGWPVRLVGVGGGVEYGPGGPSHHGMEDLGVMRVQPKLTVVVPADYQQTRTALLKTWDLSGPIYYRLGKDDTYVLPGLEGRFELGRADLIRDGQELLFVVTGAIARQVVAAADILLKHNIQAGILIVSSLRPPPEADLLTALSRFSRVVTVEAHYRDGGLGSLVCETVAENGLAVRVVRLGLGINQSGLTGSEDYLLRQQGLSIDDIVNTARKVVEDR